MPARLALLVVLVLAASVRADEPALPKPGVGLFFKQDAVAALRAKIKQPPCKAVFEDLVKQADAARARWPEDRRKLRIAELAPRLPDLTMENVPAEHAPTGGAEAGAALEGHALHGAPAAAFVFLMTGQRPYADFAWEVFEQCARVNRWGWFPWNGSHMPQIHFGMISRNLCLIADSVWDTLTPPQRRQARAAIAEKCVKPYYRLVLHTPGMGLYHLRSWNQGNNALAAALIGSLFVGDAVPDNRTWLGSLLQTYHWILTHDIGRMGQHLETGAYWEISIQNLYTAATVLNNMRGIDLRAHPGFDQAVSYPLIHESTVPPLSSREASNVPIPRDFKGRMGFIESKPINLPHDSQGGPWWFDYAARFPGSPARYVLKQGPMMNAERISAVDCHQGTLSEVLLISWWDERVRGPVEPPAGLSLFTDRMAGLRSGYGFGETYLYFNGDLFLSAKKEILAATSGLTWHFPWHQYQITESGLETEGELFAPSMVIQEAHDDPQLCFFRAESGPSNVCYYRHAEQAESYKHYQKRERSVLYVRGGKDRSDYFLFLDEVRHKEPRWHAWTWHLWDRVGHPENYGRFIPVGERAVRAERPNADLWIQFLAPERVAVEQHGIPSQPVVYYEMDHNARMMRAIAGGYSPAEAKPVTIPITAWGDAGAARDGALFLEKVSNDRPAVTQVVKGLTGGVRYRWSVQAKKQDYRVYEGTAWEINLELLDARGKVVARPTTAVGHPHPLRLGAPASDLATHDWMETVQYFDAPPEAVACRVSLPWVGGKLWLRPIELRPVGKPVRTTEQRFLTLVMPLAKKAVAPKVTLEKGKPATVVHTDGTGDEITLTAEGRLQVVRRKGQEVVARFTGKFSGDNLKTNSTANARRYAAGLKPVLDAIAAERDLYTHKGHTNLARGVRVIASATRDARFAAGKVVDNETAEYPTDGRLDYTLGTVLSSNQTAGSGAGKESLLDNRGDWPLYVRPTYWLLPEGKLGHVELELALPATVERVRLLNTSNAGLNDFATHHFRVELYGAEHRLLASKEGRFGEVFDRPFRQAFFVPKWLSHYPATFAGMLEPGLTVPFGDGWKEAVFERVPDVHAIRVVITKYWGIGGGLNEVQVYGS
jgi:hypothetical protein